MFDDIYADNEQEQETKLTRKEKVGVWVINEMNRLIDSGLINGKKYPLTQKGIDMIKDLNPTKQEIEDGFKWLYGGGESVPKGLVDGTKT